MCHSCCCERPVVVAKLDDLAHVLAPIANKIDALEALMAATQAEVLAKIADLATLADETQKDVARVITKLDEAIAAGDMTAVSAAVDELRTHVQPIDDAAEAAAPEPVEAPPADGGDGSADAGEDSTDAPVEG